MKTPHLSRVLLTATGIVLVTAAMNLPPADAADFVSPSCPGFDVGLTPLSGHGNPVQAGPRAVVAAGSGTSILDNETTGSSIPFHGAGAFNISDNPDGSLIFTSTGQTVVFLYDTNNGGPATTIYTGGIVSEVAPDGTFTVLSHTGKAVDVCSLLDH
jgi:hypothetical protein